MLDLAKGANLLLMFLLEPGVLFSVGYWGLTLDASLMVRVAAAVYGVALFIAVWAVFGAAQHARVPLRGPSAPSWRSCGSAVEPLRSRPRERSSPPSPSRRCSSSTRPCGSPGGSEPRDRCPEYGSLRRIAGGPASGTRLGRGPPRVRRAGRGLAAPLPGDGTGRWRVLSWARRTGRSPRVRQVLRGLLGRRVRVVGGPVRRRLCHSARTTGPAPAPHEVDEGDHHREAEARDDGPPPQRELVGRLVLVGAVAHGRGVAHRGLRTGPTRRHGPEVAPHPWREQAEETEGGQGRSQHDRTGDSECAQGAKHGEVSRGGGTEGGAAGACGPRRPRGWDGPRRRAVPVARLPRRGARDRDTQLTSDP
ncbi:uncharacterized protein DUF2568 [Nocardiopsis sp. Huas11]|nr:uncharacterized protein DUF2568 [Nocardiopsis sp. Huas11]